MPCSSSIDKSLPREEARESEGVVNGEPLLYLSLGGNQGDRAAFLWEAIRLITARVGRLHSLSSLYETEPWGFESAQRFFNAVAVVRTPLSPTEVLARTQLIEKELGRAKKTESGGSYQDRPIDIDLLAHGDCVMSTPELTLPHPLMTQRGFVLRPLVEVAPHWVHPVSGRTARTLLEELER